MKSNNIVVPGDQIIKPSQIAAGRLDQLWEWKEQVNEALQQMDHNIGRYLMSMQIQINAIQHLIIDKGIATEDELKDTLKIEQETAQKKYDEHMQQVQPKEPVIVNPDELGKLEG